jgi:hypothetical protein
MLSWTQVRPFLTFTLLLLITASACLCSDLDPREAVHTFFSKALKDEDATPPEEFLELSTYVLAEFKNGESFEEVLDEEKRTKLGYVTIKLLLPEKFRQPFAACKLIPDLKPRVGALAFPLNTKYVIEIAEGQVSNNNGQSAPEYRFQIYRDLRQNRWKNAYRCFMPTASNSWYLDGQQINVLLCRNLVGFLTEWFLIIAADKELEQDPFSVLLRKNVGAYLKRIQSDLRFEWGKAYKALQELEPACNIVTGLEDHEEGVSSAEQIMKQIRVYNQVIVLKPAKDVLDQISQRLVQLRFLTGPPSEQAILGLFLTDQASARPRYQFAFGAECLTYYFGRLRMLSPADLKAECAVLINCALPLIPALLQMKTEVFAKKAREEDPKGLADALLVGSVGHKDNSMSVVTRLIETRRLIQELSPGKQSFVIKSGDRGSLEAASQVVQKKVVAGVASHLAQQPNLLALFHQMISLNALKTHFFNIQIPTYPARENLTFDAWLEAMKSQLFAKVVVDCRIHLTSFAKPLNYICKDLCHRLAFVLEALGHKDKGTKLFRKSVIEASLEDFMQTIIDMPEETVDFILQPQPNVELLKLTRALISFPTFGVIQPGILRFIAENENNLSPSLLSLFAEFYLIKYNASDFPHPLGEKPDARLANFLSLLLLRTIQGNGQMSLADLKEKKIQSHIDVLKSTLDKLKSYNFEPEDFN